MARIDLIGQYDTHKILNYVVLLGGTLESLGV